MSRFPAFAFLALLPAAAAAQETEPKPAPWFVHLGADRVDPGAGAFGPVLEGGLPILRWGPTCLGVYAGATQWRRGGFTAAQVRDGDLLDKTSWWAGSYVGGAFWSFGLAGEYATWQSYATPTAGNGFYDGTGHSRAGAGFFAGLRGASGFGAFLRAGTVSGFGFGLSFHF